MIALRIPGCIAFFDSEVSVVDRVAFFPSAASLKIKYVTVINMNIRNGMEGA
jgi:hypothetical protein